MFQSLRPNNQLYVLYKDEPKLDIGSVISVSLPYPKYNQPQFGYSQEMLVDIVVKVNNEDFTYKKIPANLDIADFGNNGVVISDNKDAMNSEVISLKNRSSDIVNSVNYHNNIISGCDDILKNLNPELAEKQEQRREIDELRAQILEITKSMNGIVASNKQLIDQLSANNKEHYENVGN